MNCVPSSPPLAPQIKPRTLVEQRERGYFGGLIGDVLHFPVRRKHDVQQVYKDILVPLVSENSLESGIGKYVHISLHNSFSLPLYCFSDSYICFGYIPSFNVFAHRWRREVPDDLLARLWKGMRRNANVPGNANVFIICKRYHDLQTFPNGFNRCRVLIFHSLLRKFAKQYPKKVFVFWKTFP